MKTLPEPERYGSRNNHQIYKLLNKMDILEHLRRDNDRSNKFGMARHNHVRKKDTL